MLQIILLLGQIREILTSDDKEIKMNNLTPIFLDYIKMIEGKEQANKDAPTEEVKNNVTKIYTEVNKILSEEAENLSSQRKKGAFVSSEKKKLLAKIGR